jgi:hypothetical protein
VLTISAFPLSWACVTGLVAFAAFTEDEQHKVADAIVQHLESTNWKIEKGPPAEGHGQYLIPPR